MQNKKPLLSVIVPIYNTREYLRKCVESVLDGAGKYRDQVQIVLVNDGSPDGAIEECLDLCVDYENVETLAKSNEGVSRARNSGMELCRGEYLTFVDSDDVVTSNFEKALDYVAENKDNEIYEFGLMKNGQPLQTLPERVYDGTNFKDLYALVKRRITICCVCKIFKTDFIKNNGILFPEGTKSEDFVFAYSAITKAKHIAVKNLFYYDYIDRSTSVTHSYKLRGLLDQLANCNRVKDLIDQLNFTPKQKQKLCRYLFETFVYMVVSVCYLDPQDQAEAIKQLEANKQLLFKPHKFSFRVVYYLIKRRGTQGAVEFIKKVKSR